MHRSQLAGFIIDCPTDDIEAEMARLEEPGARRIADIRRWVVMQAPTGQRFLRGQPTTLQL